MKRLGNNKIHNRLQKIAGLNDILLSTDKDAQPLMKELYNKGDKDTNRALQILSDAGFRFNKAFFEDSKIVALADSAKDFLAQYINEQLDQKLDEALSDAVINTTGTEENTKDVIDSLTDEQKQEFLFNYLNNNVDIYKDKNVANISNIWVDEILSDESKAPYFFQTINMIEGIRKNYLQDKDVVDALMNTIDLKDFEDAGIEFPDKVILDQSKQILEELGKTYKVYQSPDGLVVMEK